MAKVECIRKSYRLGSHTPSKSSAIQGIAAFPKQLLYEAGGVFDGTWLFAAKSILWGKQKLTKHKS